MRNRRSIRRNHDIRINRYVLLCAFVALFAVILAATGMFVQANEKSDIVYSSVEIHSHDTLWDIANTYCDTKKESINDYIENLKSINNMSSDRINSGNYIIVYEFR